MFRDLNSFEKLIKKDFVKGPECGIYYCSECKREITGGCKCGMISDAAGWVIWPYLNLPRRF
jgi:hypothetical protein